MPQPPTLLTRTRRELLDAVAADEVDHVRSITGASEAVWTRPAGTPSPRRRVVTARAQEAEEFGWITRGQVPLGRTVVPYKLTRAGKRALAAAIAADTAAQAGAA